MQSHEHAMGWRFWRRGRGLEVPSSGNVPQPDKKHWQDHAVAMAARAYMTSPGQPVWTPRSYDRLAEESYTRNVIAYRSIAMVARALAGVQWRIMDADGRVVKDHPALKLMRMPHSGMDGGGLIEALASYRQMAGNAYVLAVGPEGLPPLELHVLRPDRVQVLAGAEGSCVPVGYRYQVGNKQVDYRVNALSGQCQVWHWRQFHPLSDWYGLSCVEPAAYSIDQHNQAGAWNQALLQNGARPSGAPVVTPNDSNLGGVLSEEQYQQLKQQIDMEFSGPGNAGRPLLLQGGLEWREMSHNPKDMDFLNSKHSAARDIALAFGVPPQLLGIPGDNTYSNYKEARLAFWEETVLPMVESLAQSMGAWLLRWWPGSEGLRLDVDRDEISALGPRREAYWERVNSAGFLSDEEKRRLLMGMV